MLLARQSSNFRFLSSSAAFLANKHSFFSISQDRNPLWRSFVCRPFWHPPVHLRSNPGREYRLHSFECRRKDVRAYRILYRDRNMAPNRHRCSAAIHAFGNGEHKCLAPLVDLCVCLRHGSSSPCLRIAVGGYVLSVPARPESRVCADHATVDASNAPRGGVLGNPRWNGSIVHRYDLQVCFDLGSCYGMEEATIFIEQSGWPHGSELSRVCHTVWLVDCCLYQPESTW